MFPPLTIEGEPAKKLKNLVSEGDTISATVQLRITGITEPEAGAEGYAEGEQCVIDTEVESIEVAGAAEPEQEGIGPDEAMDTFFKAKRTAPTPMMEA